MTTRTKASPTAWGTRSTATSDTEARSRSRAFYYKDGKQIEGKTTTVEIDHRIGWSRKLDNRKVANSVTVAEKIISFEETFNKLTDPHLAQTL